MAGGTVGDGKFVKLLANPCCCQIRQLRVGGRWTCEQAAQVDATLIWVWDKMRQSGQDRAKSCLLQPLRPGPSNLLPADDVYVCKPLFSTPSLIVTVDLNMFACLTVNSQFVARVLEQLKSKEGPFSGKDFPKHNLECGGLECFYSTAWNRYYSIVLSRVSRHSICNEHTHPNGLTGQTLGWETSVSKLTSLSQTTVKWCEISQLQPHEEVDFRR